MSFNGHGARAGNVFWLIPLSTPILEYTQQPNNCGSCPEQTTTTTTTTTTSPCAPRNLPLSSRSLAHTFEFSNLFSLTVSPHNDSSKFYLSFYCSSLRLSRSIHFIPNFFLFFSRLYKCIWNFCCSFVTYHVMITRERLWKFERDLIPRESCRRTSQQSLAIIWRGGGRKIYSWSYSHARRVENGAAVSILFFTIFRAASYLLIDTSLSNPLIKRDREKHHCRNPIRFLAFRKTRSFSPLPLDHYIYHNKRNDFRGKQIYRQERNPSFENSIY